MGNLIYHHDDLVKQIKNIQSKLSCQNLSYDVLIQKTNNITVDEHIDSKKIDDFKKHMSHYEDILNGLKEANQYDIYDCNFVLITIGEGKNHEYYNEESLINCKNAAETRYNNYHAQSEYYANLANTALPTDASYYSQQSDSYKNMANQALSEKSMYEKRLEYLYEVENLLSNSFTRGSFLRDFVYKGILELYGDYNEKGEFVGKDTLSWRKEYEYAKKNEEKKRIHEFYNSLPYNVRTSITEEDIVCTDDGFFMVKVPISKMLTAKGITDTGINENNNQDVDAFYDDWFLYGIKGADGKYTYSAIKIRETESDSILKDENGNPVKDQDGKDIIIADSDSPGVTVSFVELDINKFDKVLENGPDWKGDEAKEKDMEEFTKNYQMVTGPDPYPHSDKLKNYFNRTDADAPYLIADVTIDVIASSANDEGHIGLPDDFSSNAREPIVDELRELNKKSGKIIYDEENHRLNIDNPNELTEYEKQAILIAFTGDLTVNSFAAEVEYHADAIDRTILGQIKYGSSIRADMNYKKNIDTNPFKAAENWWRETFEEHYFDLDSDEVNNQRLTHGDR